MSDRVNISIIPERRHQPSLVSSNPNINNQGPTNAPTASSNPGNVDTHFEQSNHCTNTQASSTRT